MFLGVPAPDLLGFGSGSFHHQAKIVRKTLISTVLRLLYDLSLKNDLDVPSTRNKQKKILFCSAADPGSGAFLSAGSGIL
jgi:hypothetical protein